MSCSICLCEYENPQVLRCGHVFCNACILRSLRETSACPLCKSDCWKRSLTYDAKLSDLIQRVKEFHDLTEMLVSTAQVTSRALSQSSEAIEFGTCTQLEEEISRFQSIYAQKSEGAEEACNEIEKIQKQIEKQRAAKKKILQSISRMEETISKRTAEIEEEEKRMEERKKAKSKRVKQVRARLREKQSGKKTSEEKKKGERRSSAPPSVPARREPLQELPSNRTPPASERKAGRKRKHLADEVGEGSTNGGASVRVKVEKKEGAMQRHQQVASLSSADAILSPPSSSSKPRLASKGDGPVILTTGLTSDEYEEVRHTAALLGGSVARGIKTKFTHVVAHTNESNKAKRTVKYSAGIVSGACVVGLKWVTDSHDNGAFLPEDDYILDGDDNNGHIGGPRKAYLALKDEERLLFEGLEFYLHGTFSSRLPSKEDLRMLITMGGGKVTAKLPGRTSAGRKIIVIVDSETLTHKEYSDLTQRGHQPVMGQWILDSISTFELQPKEEFAGFPLCSD